MSSQPDTTVHNTAPEEQVFNNARIILDDEIIDGHLCVSDGLIKSIDTGLCTFGEDLNGDYLMPGIIELHTDHLETHHRPRPGVRWPLTAAIQAHDGQIATAGITTVFDCLRLGTAEEDDPEIGEMRRMADALMHAMETQRLRVDHRLHLRCEVSSPDVLEAFQDFAEDPHVGLVSLMDHAPGERQFASIEAAAEYYQGTLKLSDERFQQFVQQRQEQSTRYATLHRKQIAEYCQHSHITAASHDDATIEHVEESLGLKLGLAEFPTSIDAARHAHNNGMAVMMGAPNMVRGQSHSGNVSARQLAENGLLDVLSSDYVPFSLIQAVFMMAGELELMTLPEAVQCVSSNPARVVGLNDRGRLAEGLRADLLRTSPCSLATGPVVRGVWSGGRRVA